MESIYESQVDPLRPNDAHGISLQLVGKNKKVLELGAASGHVTQALKALNNTVTAVERDGRFKDRLVELADEVVITDLDWLDLREKLAGQKFDVVLAGDVLEHCSRPELVLLQLHELLKNNGYVVISLPNIAHGDVRLSLLTGSFDYRDTGLLDRTHLRFFTRSSIETFLTNNHFNVDEIFASTASIGTTEFGPPKASIPIEAIKFVEQDRDAMVYQFIVKATPKTLRENEEAVIPKTRSEHEQIDQLLAEISLYQESLSHTQSRTQHEVSRIFDYLDEIASLKHEISTSQNDLRIAQTDVLTAQHENNLVIAKLRESQLSLLDARDHAIGAAAELGEIRFLQEISLREIDSLSHQLYILHGSRTWKIGRFVLLPLRAVRKVLSLLMD
jgi:2-polyprenyl-3-methyl-5-hydroxy-6-metoxy-1,4-benzoquinol methylase